MMPVFLGINFAGLNSIVLVVMFLVLPGIVLFVVVVSARFLGVDVSDKGVITDGCGLWLAGRVGWLLHSY